MRQRKGLVDVMRVLLGTIYCYAGLSKATDLHSFGNVITQFDLLPLSLILPVAVFIVAAEMFLGSALLVGVQPRKASLLLGCLTFLFLGAVAIVLMNGKSIECGCFGNAGSEIVGVGVIARDVLLIICCIWLSAPGGSDDVAAK